MKARILLPGSDYRDVTGRTVESIARTHFGRDVEVRPEHSEVLDPGVIRWTVTRWVAVNQAHSVLGTIVTWPTRPGPGRPPKHDAPMIRTPLRLPPAVRAEVIAAAEREGRGLNDELVSRIARPVPSPTQPEEG